MKKILPEIVLFAAVVLLSFQCEDMHPRESAACIDTKLKNRNQACYDIFRPVCGCDGKTYGNDCYARANGVIKFTAGACAN